MPLPPIKSPKAPNKLSYVVIFALIIAIFYFTTQGDQSKKPEQVSLSKFLTQVRNQEIKKVEVKDNELLITLIAEEKKEIAVKEARQTITEILQEIPDAQRINLEVEVINTEGRNFWLNIIISILPFALLIGFFIYMFRQAQGSNNQAMSFGKSKAKLHDKEKSKTTFKDVAGALEAKEELIEIVDFLKNPNKYTSMGAKIPKGVILIGSPGTGKTLLARAVAGEANVPFFSIAGSEFVEMFVGVGASRVRDLFKKAKRNAPCIIFIDEIDAVGRQRGAGLGGGHDEREQTLNQILTEMDGFETGANVIVMAATNRPDVLDPALLRPGRFDRRITVDQPDLADREAILKVHGRNKPLNKEVELKQIAKQTPGFSGADLENIMNEAAILSARESKKKIGQKELEQSVEKVMMGPEKKSKLLSKKEQKITAYHEIGHALVAHLTKECDPVHKISIISRGMSLGSTWMLPEEDKHLYSVSKFKGEIASLLGGHVAEQLTFGEVTTGASSDLQRASKIARKMVSEYGMSNLGPIVFGEPQHEVFLGKDYGHTKNYSEEMSKKIDEEVNKLIIEQHDYTTKLLAKNKDLLGEISEALLKKENLSRPDFLKFF